jgi:ABC-type Co2+ transport system permease subunit
MNILSRTTGTSRPVWVPPAVAVATLFGLFASAMAVRHSPFADAGRPVMIALSTAASAAIAIYGLLMLVQARARGIASALAGLIMLVLGLYTGNHVLR